MRITQGHALLVKSMAKPVKLFQGALCSLCRIMKHAALPTSKHKNKMNDEDPCCIPLQDKTPSLFQAIALGISLHPFSCPFLFGCSADR